MRLIDEDEAERLYADMGPAREVSGGSAANTAAGIAALGRSAGFIGQLADDQLGEIFAHDIRSLGVEFDTPPKTIGATARCLILVTPDAQRTMNTFLGAAQNAGPGRASTKRVAARQNPLPRRLSVGPGEPRAAMYKAMDAARAAGTQSRVHVVRQLLVDRHRTDSCGCSTSGQIDILFANEAEIRRWPGPPISNARSPRRGKSQTLVVTRSERGAVATRGGERAEVPAEPIERAGRHDRRRRSVRRRVPRRRGAGLEPRTVAEARRDLRRRSHPALRRAARRGPQGAGRRHARIERAALAGPPSFSCPRAGRRLAAFVARRVLGETALFTGVDDWPLASSELCMP